MSEQRAIIRLNKVAGHVTRGPYIAKNKYEAELIRTARGIATRGKGILAADESTGTIGKRFDSIKVKNTVENRRAYRELLFTSKDLGKYISGAILYEETLYQKTADGTPFVDVLKNAGVLIGIKVDLGTKVIPGTDNETSTQGLTDLDKRCQKYYKQGARFAKWRAVVRISEKTPTETAIHETAWGLARYAAICQDNGLAPIVEPEILIDGDHDIATSQYWTEKVVSACYKALIDQHVILEGTLLKPNMVTPGKSCPKQVSPDVVARATITALRRTVPSAVPGITFLSGGQSEEQATVHLNAMNNPKYGNHPWSLTFSYGRALQQSCLKAWKGKKENFAAGQAAFLTRARANSQAQLGKYKGEAASGSANESLFVEKYTY